ncbi:hypothetical protein [Photobacterium indicum]|uniref:Nitrate/nitrite sensing protein domain-containing protein n=1 Tax=Photobacterium indicum TaxID=81447 RepID=A0A2T3LAX5_9GAMM|nr:hypothetical protein [Photobacterium indicum]PSV48478.1 hypothetical protein C9J47_08170 [Photobacterium indicum]
MLILLLLVIIFGASCFFLWQARENKRFLQTRFDQVIGLRQLIFLLRFHRRETHHFLSQSHPLETAQLNEVVAIKSLMKILSSRADKVHKPMYRILAKQINKLLDEWLSYSVRRNQAAHGKAIRHVLYLIDDVVTQSLLAADKEALFKTYQTAWPITLNSIDSLSRFRYAIDSYTLGKNSSKRELRIHISVIQRRLGQIALLTNKPPLTFMIEDLMLEFESINLQARNLEDVKGELYQLSLKISDTIFNLFDIILTNIATDISVRFPELQHTSSNVVAFQKTPNLYSISH